MEEAEDDGDGEKKVEEDDKKPEDGAEAVWPPVAEKKKKYVKAEVPGEVKVYWIDDSSCTIKFANESLAKSAYTKLALSAPREEDQTPPLITDIRNKQQAYRAQNPTYDSLFSGEAEQQNEGVGENPEEAASDAGKYDPRNFEIGLEFIDVFDCKKEVRINGDLISDKHNLWIRWATTKDRKSEQTKGENSRFY